MNCHICDKPSSYDALKQGTWKPVCDEHAASLGCAVRSKAHGRVTIGPAPGNAKGDALFALRSALPYLEHPQVQAMPFAVPAETVAARVRAAIQKAEAEGWV